MMVYLSNTFKTYIDKMIFLQHTYIFFRDYIDCICHVWHGPEQLGLSGALGDPGLAGEHNMRIFSLMCSLTSLGDFRCA